MKTIIYEDRFIKNIKSLLITKGSLYQFAFQPTKFLPILLNHIIPNSPLNYNVLLAGQFVKPY